MKSTKSTGRLVGLLLLVHLVAGLMLPFILLDRVRGSAGLLANAAASPALFRAAVLLLIAGSAIAVAAAVAAAPVLRPHSEAAALALVAVAVAAFVLQVVDTGALMAILALSRERATAAAGATALDPTLGAVITAGRLWLHFSYLLVAVAWILLLNLALLRFGLVPRLLTALCAVGCLLQLAGVSLPGLLGFRLTTVMAMPLAPAYLGLAGWLISRGFADRSAGPAGGARAA